MKAPQRAVCASLVGALCSTSALRAQVPTQVPLDTTSVATISGSVVDASTRARIAQAVVSLRGRGLRATTDMNGNFALRRVPTGSYALEVKRIGYEPLVQDSVVVGTSRVELQLEMKPAAFQLANVTVWFSILPSLGVEWSRRF